MARLSICLLGPFQVRLDEELVTSFKSDKVRALLAYLAVEGDRPHRRESLATLLWPDWPHQDALANLRNVLYHLRLAIDDHVADSPFLLITRETIQFNRESDHWLDVAALTAAMSLNEAGQVDNDFLRDAVAAYGGPFLEGFSLPDSSSFEDWLTLKREELERLALVALHHLAAYHEGRGQYAQAQAYAQRQVVLAPWNEEGHRQLIRLLALSGQRSAALAQYETCRRLLAEELRVEPAPETTALYQQIRQGRLARQIPAKTSAADYSLEAPLALPEESYTAELPLFVAREGDLRKLERFLDKALAGLGQVAFVVGEAGSGKTTLLQEFARRAMAAHEHLVVACGHCNAYADFGDPYLPFLEVLRLLSGDIEAGRGAGAITPGHAQRLWSLLPLSAQALLDVGPDLIDLFIPGGSLLARARAFTSAASAWLVWLEEVVQQKDLGSSSLALRQKDLYEQYAGVLRAIARERPLLLVLDDLQWADSGSISLLFHLGRQLAGCRILVLGAYRPGDVALGRWGERHPLEPVVNELRTSTGDILVDLDRTSGRQFVDALLDSEPNLLGEPFRRTLYRHTGGHALFTVELLRGLQERGGLKRDKAGRWIEGEELEWEKLPQRVEAMIEERISRLPREWRQTLAVASVEGEEFTAEAVASVQGVAEEEIIRLLSEELGNRHRLVRAEALYRVAEQPLSRYRFRHYLFQRYLYESLDAVERVHLHESVGRVLEELYREETSEIAVHLARHFEEAGMTAKAVEYLRQAGQRALWLCSHEEAVTLLRRGLALLQALPASQERDRQELALQLPLGAALQAARGMTAPEMIAVYTRSLELCLCLGRPEELHPVAINLAGSHLARAEYQKAQQVWERYASQALDQGDSLSAMMAHVQRGLLLNIMGKFVQARAESELALALYNPEQHRSRMLACYIVDYGIVVRGQLAWCLWFLGYPDQTWKELEQALSEARVLGHAYTLIRILQNSMYLAYDLHREVETVRKWSDLAERIEFDRSSRLRQPMRLFYQGWVRALIGQHELGIAQMRQGLDERLAQDNPMWQSYHLARLAEAYGKAGRPEEGLTALAEALAHSQRTNEHFSLAEIHRLKGDLLFQRGDPGDAVEAEACFRRAIATARRQEAKLFELQAATGLARLLAGQGRREEARQMLAAVYGWFTEGFDTYDLKEAKALLEELSDG